jgi:hypothetical protein
MKEAHGRAVLAGRRETPESYSPQAAPAPHSSRTPGHGHTPNTLPRGNSHDALIENLEGRLKRLSGPFPPFPLCLANCSQSPRHMIPLDLKRPLDKLSLRISAGSSPRSPPSHSLIFLSNSRVTPPTTPPVPSHGSHHPSNTPPPAPSSHSRSRVDMPPPVPERSLPQVPGCPSLASCSPLTDSNPRHGICSLRSLQNLLYQQPGSSSPFSPFSPL